jgi:hypothetical protein
MTSTPNGELTTQAWLARYVYTADQVGATLPAPAKWVGSGFVQVRALPGGPVYPDLPHRRVTVTQVDLFGTRSTNDTFRPLWSVAMDLAEKLRLATFPDAQVYGKPLTIAKAGYSSPRALSAYLLSEPMRVEGDPSGYARIMTQLSLTWTV